MRLFTLLAISATLLVAVGCGATKTLSDSEKEAQALVESYVQNHEIYIEVESIQSSRGGIRHTTDGYFLKIKDGKANSYLPFMGEAYMANYGSLDKPEIEFKDCPVTVDETVNSKGKHTWTFVGKSGDVDVQTKIEFFSSGMASITCTSMKRTPMYYHGTVTVDRRKIDKK